MPASGPAWEHEHSPGCGPGLLPYADRSGTREPVYGDSAGRRAPAGPPFRCRTRPAPAKSPRRAAAGSRPLRRPYGRLADALEVTTARVRAVAARWRAAGYAVTGVLGPGRRGAG